MTYDYHQALCVLCSLTLAIAVLCWLTAVLGTNGRN